MSATESELEGIGAKETKVECGGDDEEVVGPFTWPKKGEVMEEHGEITVDAYGCKKAGGPVELMKVTLPPLRSTQVQVEMSHCGLCHTEIHMIDNDWGVTDYPLVPGHEGFGIVSVVGSAVPAGTIEVGDEVGVGWIRDSCGDCTKCSCGRENLCSKGYQGTILGPSASGIWGNQKANMFGCFAKTMRLESSFAFKVPKNCPPAIACPLMCAGGTLFEPIENHIEKGMSIGIAGIGGLGTLGLKLAKLKGATVTAISRTDAKKGFSLKAGADDFISMADKEAIAAAACTLDVIIDTSPAGGEPEQYLNLLKFDGKLVRVGLPPGKEAAFSYNWIPLIFCQRSIVGSVVTGSKNMKNLLKLAETEVEFLMENDPNWNAVEVPFSDVAKALASLKEGTNKGYRTILKW